jgi:hypothetical protein
MRITRGNAFTFVFLKNPSDDSKVSPGLKNTDLDYPL